MRYLAVFALTLIACAADATNDEKTVEPGLNGSSAPGSDQYQSGVDVTGEGSVVVPAGPVKNEPVENPASAELSPARRLAAKLGRPSQMLIGLGNDAADLGDANKTHAYALGPQVDIHYMYLSNFEWPTWKPNGGYVTQHANAAKSRGITPMFTLYQAAVAGDGNVGALNDQAFMTKYWSGVRLLFTKLAEFDAPAIVHLEPDLWGYAQKKNGDDPASTPIKVKSECADLPNDIAGMARCTIRIARQLSPKTLIGLSASSFGAPAPERVANFLKALGAGETDMMVVETLDRDAGCFEQASDPNCKRNGTFYWDENNVQHPNFHDHLAWTKTIHEVTGLPLLWWQMPLGRPAAAKGGSPGAYRDNRVKYFFSHPEEFEAAGGFGAVFGKGKANQTTTMTDGGQFATALNGYRAAPAALR